MDDPLARPLGWWLKEADARIDATFERSLGTLGLDRRRWQILASLARGPRQQRDLAQALRRFDADLEIHHVVADLINRGLVDRGDAGLDLTARGSSVQQQAATYVDTARTRVHEALGDDGYRQLIHLLATVVEALPDNPARNGA